MTKQKLFRAVILYPGNGGPDGVEKLIESASAADAGKTAKRLAEEMNGRVFWFGLADEVAES